MVRSLEFTSISYRLPPGLLAASLTLCCCLVGGTYPAQASQATATASELKSPENVLLKQSLSNTSNAISDVSNSPAPMLAQVPGGMGTVPSGMPVPWNTSPTWVGTATGQPIGAPVTNPGGTWVMIWVPNGAAIPAIPPMVPGPMPGTIAYPMGGPLLPAAQPSIPAAYPGMVSSGAPSGNYYAYPYQAQPYQAQPYQTQPYQAQPYQPQPYLYQTQPYQAQPYQAQPYPYQVQPSQAQPYPYQAQPYSYGAPGGSNSFLPALPASGLGQPATSLNSLPSGGNQPLSVPGIPSQGLSGTVPPPPTQPLPNIPAFGQPTSPGYTSQSFPPAGVAPQTGQFSSTPGPLSLQEAALPASNTAAAPLSLTGNNAPLTKPTLSLQGLYAVQRDRSAVRARLGGTAFLTPNLLLGGTVDVGSGQDLVSGNGVQLTELYLATAMPGVPGLRFRVGQLDLTSYFDRNSFAKDIARDFFNPTFNTNPALIAAANSTASHTGGLAQWAITDDITLTASAFSSASGISGFALDGFASEVSFRTGNLILRGTYLTSKDTQIQNTGDRLNSYGVNAEWFLPGANLGFFGRYGRLTNVSTNFATDTYSLGVNALDLFMKNDRLGLAYGRNLSTTSVNGRTPDALEIFYDFQALPNVRVGFTFQQLNQFTESVAGFRIRGDLDLTPSLSNR